MTNIKKLSVRAKMNMLDLIGKSEIGTDKFVDECDEKVNAIYNSSVTLRKEMKKYFAAQLSLSEAEVTMNKVILNLYEDKWEGRASFEEELKKISECSKHLSDKLTNKMFDDLDKYISEYAPTKERVKQKNRKCAYYKNAKLNLESAEKEKKVDEQKVKRLQLEHQDAKRVLDIYNQQVREDLPRFCNKRLDVFVDTWINMFETLKNSLHEKSLQYKAILGSLESFKEENKSGRYALTIPSGQDSSRSLFNQEILDEFESEYNSAYDTNDTLVVSTRHTSFLSHRSSSSMQSNEKIAYDAEDVDESSVIPPTSESDAIYEYSETVKVKDATGVPIPAMRRIRPQVPPKTGLEKVLNDDTSQNFVKVIHDYVTSMDDELNLECDQILKVIDYDDNDFDEGWLYGVRQSDGAKGLFPENYTMKFKF